MNAPIPACLGTVASDAAPFRDRAFYAAHPAVFAACDEFAREHGWEHWLAAYHQLLDLCVGMQRLPRAACEAGARALALAA